MKHTHPPTYTIIYIPKSETQSEKERGYMQVVEHCRQLSKKKSYNLSTEMAQVYMKVDVLFLLATAMAISRESVFHYFNLSVLNNVHFLFVSIN